MNIHPHIFNMHVNFTYFNWISKHPKLLYINENWNKKNKKKTSVSSPFKHQKFNNQSFLIAIKENLKTLKLKFYYNV